MKVISYTNPETNEQIIKQFNNREEVRAWVVAHLDLSVDYIIEELSTNDLQTVINKLEQARAVLACFDIFGECTHQYTQIQTTINELKA